MQIITLYKTEYGFFKDKQKAIDHYRRQRYYPDLEVFTENDILLIVKEAKVLYCNGEYFKLKQLVIEDE